MTAKISGACCPVCKEDFPAEYAMAGQEPRWRCLKCDASGTLVGIFNARKPAGPKPQPQPILKRHWKDRP